MAQAASSIPQKPQNILAPLSFAQQRLWFLYQYNPQSPEYNISRAWRLKGPLDTQALTCSLHILLERHESLRTIFQEIDGQPVQVVEPIKPIHLPEKDFSCFFHTGLEKEIDAFLTKEQLKPFNLTERPPLRFTLLKCGPQDHVLVFTIHHIVFDGRSLQIFCQELSQYYAASLVKLPNACPPLSVQYQDYAFWQQSQITAQKMASQITYWNERLHDAPLVLELPTDSPRPTDSSGPRSYQTFTLTPQVLVKLKQLIRPQGMTLFMGLLAVFKILLSRYTDQWDILVGTPIEGRTHKDLEPLIGFLVNTLVLRTQLNPQLTFLEVLDRVRTTCLEAYRHQDVPFEKLVEVLKPMRDPSRYPIVQMLFQLRQAADLHLSFPGIFTDPFLVKRRTANFDLHIVCDQNKSGIQGFIYFSQELYSDSMMARFVKHYENLLEQLIANAQQPVSRISFVPEAEIHQQVHDWNATHQELPPNECIHHLVEAQTRLTPDAIAVVFEDQAITYAQLHHQANALARHLQQLGVGLDRPVGICIERSIDMVISMLAVLKAGGAYVPLDPTYPQSRLTFMLTNAEVTVLVTQKQFQPLFAECPSSRVWIEDVLPFGQETKAQPEPTSTNPANLAYVMYTSGSTGQPKGVAMPHQALVNLITWQAQQTMAPRDARTLQFTSLNFDVSAQEIFSTLAGGGTLVLVSDILRQEPLELINLLISARIERLFIPVVALHQLAEVAQTCELFPSEIQEVITAGESLQITPVLRGFLANLPSCNLHNHYGPTETHVCTAATLTGPSKSWPVRPSIGYPIANHQVYVLDKWLQPVPLGVAGELFIEGIGVARNYISRPDLTAERFLPNPFGPAGGTRLYRTGDVVRFRTTGNIEFLGRMDQQKKLRGYRIETGEIAVVLKQHADIKQAVVIVHEANNQAHLVAYVIPSSPTQPLDQNQLIQFLVERLPYYMVPSFWVILEAIPLTPTGKIDHQKLPAPATNIRPQRNPYVPPTTALEELLVEVWQEILGNNRIGIQDNFFQLGGHSLLATTCVARLREILEFSVPLRTIFDKPTIAELAQVLETQIPNDITDR